MKEALKNRGDEIKPSVLGSWHLCHCHCHHGRNNDRDCFASVYAQGGGGRKTHTRPSISAAALAPGRHPNAAPGRSGGAGQARASLPEHSGDRGTKQRRLQLCYTQRWFLSLHSPAPGPGAGGSSSEKRLV